MGKLSKSIIHTNFMPVRMATAIELSDFDQANTKGSGLAQKDEYETFFRGIKLKPLAVSAKA